MDVPGHTLDANTLALWRLDETSAAAAATDAAGRYPLAGTSNPPVASGKVNGARVTATMTVQSGFTSAIVADGIFAAAVLAGTWTVEAWFNVDVGVTGASFPFNNHNGMMFGFGGANLIVGLAGSGGYRMDQSTGSGNVIGGTWTTLTRGAWHHIAFRSAPSGGGANVAVFVDGVFVVNLPIAARAASIGASPRFVLGGEGATFDNFAGSLDDVRISTVARTDAEIAASFWNGYLDSTRLPKSTPYRVYQTTPVSSGGLAPTFLTGPNAQAFEGALGDVKDFLSAKAKMAVQARMPLVAPSDALARIAIERGLQRGATETDAQLAARCQGAWQTWPFAGTAFGLLQAFYQTGYQNVVLAQARGGKQFTLDNGGTNLFTWSSDPGNTIWAASSATVTRNAGVAPDGTTTAAKLVDTIATGVHGSAQTVACVGGLTYVSSRDVKAAEYSVAFLINANTAFTPLNPLVKFDLIAKTAVVQSGSPVGFGIQDVGSGWFRIWMAATAAASGSGDFFVEMGDAGGNRSYTGTVGNGLLVAWPQCEVGQTPGPYAQTYGAAKTTALPAGSLLTSSPANGIWETDPLSSFSPLDQAFWSKFDVLFPLPLQAPSFSWSAGIPSSSSNEANFIRALVSAWKPAFAITNRIIIHQAGKIFGYPTTATWGTAGMTWGGATETVWTP